MKQKLKNQQEEERNNQLINDNEEPEILRRKTVKELIAPSGIDASHIDH